MTVVIPAVILLSLVFEPAWTSRRGRCWPSCLRSLVCFFFVPRFVDWTLALIAFWTTRTASANQTPASFSGAVSRSARLPPVLVTISFILPFRWMLAFPIELILGQLTPAQALWGMAIQLGWIAAILLLMLRLAGCHSPLFGSGRLTHARPHCPGWHLHALAASMNCNIGGELLGSLLEGFLGLAVALGSLAAIFGHTDNLVGWSAMELLALVGIYYIMSGYIQTFVQPSMERLLRDVHKGTLDFTLTKPEYSQLLVSVRAFAVWNLIYVLWGLQWWSLRWPAAMHPQPGRSSRLWSHCFWRRYRLQLLAHAGAQLPSGTSR